FSLYAGGETSVRPVSTSNELPDRAWTSGDLSKAGSATAVWDGYLWVPSYPGNTTITLSSPGSVAIEIDGARVADGTGSVTSQPRALAFGEHTVRLIAGATTPGGVHAEIAVDGVANDAADVLYGTSAGSGGFQALFRAGGDFGTAPVQIAHVPFAVGALPAGVGSGEYRGIYNVSSAGAYGFAVDAGSSAQLFVDDALVVDNGGSHSPRRVEGTVTLTPGDHVISLQYTGASPAPWALYLRAPGGDWRRSDGSEFTAPTTFVQPALVTLALDPTWPTDGRLVQGLDSPDGVAVLPDGTVVTGSGNTVVLVAADGSERSFKTPATDIADIDTTADGRIVLLDSVSKSLFVVTTAGDVLERFNGVFASASGVGVAADVAYVTSPSGGIVYKVPLGGGAIETLPISSAAAEVKAIQPSDIAVAGNGTLYMNDFEKHQLVISPDGVTSRKTPGAAGTGAQVPHVAIYGKLVLVTDPLNQRVLVDDLQGKQRGVFQFATGATGTHATGIAVGPHGEVYVVDPLTSRVYKLKIDIPAAATDLAQ
ncbi:MAG TPA: PA14 domain-containing protein, partial [Dehalococcoidia bacterium]